MMKDAYNNDIKQMPNMRFKNYKSVFTNLIKYRNVATAFPIITMMISYDSTRALTVTKAAENRSILKMYSLKTMKSLSMKKSVTSLMTTSNAKRLSKLTMDAPLHAFTSMTVSSF